MVDDAVAGRFLLITSPALLDELRRVLAHPKLTKLFPHPDSLVDLIAEVASVVNPQITTSLQGASGYNRRNSWTRRTAWAREATSSLR
ncbi:MAG: hypothetical protein ACRDYX_12190 [Egibacteraceae bacterium]